MFRSLFAVLAVALMVGCNKPAEKAESVPLPPQVPVAAQQQQPPAENPAPHESLLTKMTTKIVDKRKALAENPKLVSLEKNELGELNPLNYATKAYFAGVSQATVAALQHEIDLTKAMNDKFPTFEEFEQMLKRNNVKLQGLYRWQVYAYDDSNGAISILEDREFKKAEYDKAGLEYKEE
jgi:hypothetical protein